MKQKTIQMLILIHLLSSSPSAFSKEIPPQKERLNIIENKKKTEVRSNDLGFLKYVFFGVTQFLPIWGKYDEGESTKRQIPLLNFDRADGKTPNEVRLKLITKIKEYGSTEFLIFRKITFTAFTPITNSKPEKGLNTLATKAKCAAFVYWLGVNPSGEALPADSLKLAYDVSNDILNGWESKIGGFEGKQRQVYRAKENIIIMQAVDYFEASLLQAYSNFFHKFVLAKV